MKKSVDFDGSEKLRSERTGTEQNNPNHDGGFEAKDKHDTAVRLFTQIQQILTPPARARKVRKVKNVSTPSFGNVRRRIGNVRDEHLEETGIGRAEHVRHRNQGDVAQLNHTEDDAVSSRRFKKYISCVPFSRLSTARSYLDNSGGTNSKSQDINECDTNQNIPNVQDTNPWHAPKGQKYSFEVIILDSDEENINENEDESEFLKSSSVSETRYENYSESIVDRDSKQNVIMSLMAENRIPPMMPFNGQENDTSGIDVSSTNIMNSRIPETLPTREINSESLLLETTESYNVSNNSVESSPVPYLRLDNTDFSENSNEAVIEGVSTEASSGNNLNSNLQDIFHVFKHRSAKFQNLPTDRNGISDESIRGRISPLRSVPEFGLSQSHSTTNQRSQTSISEEVGSTKKANFTAEKENSDSPDPEECSSVVLLPIKSIAPASHQSRNGSNMIQYNSGEMKPNGVSTSRRSSRKYPSVEKYPSLPREMPVYDLNSEISEAENSQNIAVVNAPLSFSIQKQYYTPDSSPSESIHPQMATKSISKITGTYHKNEKTLDNRGYEQIINPHSFPNDKLPNTIPHEVSPTTSVMNFRNNSWIGSQRFTADLRRSSLPDKVIPVQTVTNHSSKTPDDSFEGFVTESSQINSAIIPNEISRHPCNLAPEFYSTSNESESTSPIQDLYNNRRAWNMYHQTRSQETDEFEYIASSSMPELSQTDTISREISQSTNIMNSGKSSSIDSEHFRIEEREPVPSSEEYSYILPDPPNDISESNHQTTTMYFQSENGDIYTWSERNAASVSPSTVSPLQNDIRSIPQDIPRTGYISTSENNRSVISQCLNPAEYVRGFQFNERNYTLIYSTTNTTPTQTAPRQTTSSLHEYSKCVSSSMNCFPPIHPSQTSNPSMISNSQKESIGIGHPLYQECSDNTVPSESNSSSKSSEPSTSSTPQVNDQSTIFRVPEVPKPRKKVGTSKTKQNNPSAPKAKPTTKTTRRKPRNNPPRPSRRFPPHRLSSPWIPRNSNPMSGPPIFRQRHHESEPRYSCNPYIDHVTPENYFSNGNANLMHPHHPSLPDCCNPITRNPDATDPRGLYTAPSYTDAEVEVDFCQSKLGPPSSCDPCMRPNIINQNTHCYRSPEPITNPVNQRYPEPAHQLKRCLEMVEPRFPSQAYNRQDEFVYSIRDPQQSQDLRYLSQSQDLTGSPQPQDLSNPLQSRDWRDPPLPRKPRSPSRSQGERNSMATHGLIEPLQSHDWSCSSPAQGLSNTSHSQDERNFMETQGLIETQQSQDWRDHPPPQGLNNPRRSQDEINSMETQEWIEPLQAQNWRLQGVRNPLYSQDQRNSVQTQEWIEKSLQSQNWRPQGLRNPPYSRNQRNSIQTQDWIEPPRLQDRKNSLQTQDLRNLLQSPDQRYPHQSQDRRYPPQNHHITVQISHQALESETQDDIISVEQNTPVISDSYYPYTNQGKKSMASEGQLEIRSRYTEPASTPLQLAIHERDLVKNITGNANYTVVSEIVENFFEDGESVVVEKKKYLPIEDNAFGREVTECPIDPTSILPVLWNSNNHGENCSISPTSGRTEPTDEPQESQVRNTSLITLLLTDAKLRLVLGIHTNPSEEALNDRVETVIETLKREFKANSIKSLQEVLQIYFRDEGSRDELVEIIMRLLTTEK